jgi:membrane-associated phospholipid phosphatase/tRNA A-37 threonylcarbamoyl transferase component Bud32
MSKLEQTQASGEAIVIPAVPRRHRRPTGAPPPLPKTIGLTGKLWLGAMLVVVISGSALLYFTTTPFDKADAPFIRGVTSLRVSWLNSFFRVVNSVGSRYGLAIWGLLTVALVAWFRRWRHLIVFMIALALLDKIGPLLAMGAQRPRPYDVVALGHWDGFAAPSLPVMALAAVLVGLAYMLVPAGRQRSTAKYVIAGILLFVSFIRIYLGVDHPTDLVFAVLLGVAIPVALFRAFTPNDIFPVRYGNRGKAAHLDVGGKRGEAIRIAMRDQLGLTIREMKPIGLEGSGGSTPLRLVVADDAGVERTVFAKLYAKSHVRADRWYKLGRTMLYGHLEDETPFKTVRRFVEYEDYTLRLLGEYGFPTPRALGIVEITPEREYLIAMDFFDGAAEIGDAEIGDEVIDEGLSMIRRMWDVGLAHRDIKPANLMVQDGHLKLIDVFFVQVRPSPWRQAVDLGNMMLVLALRCHPDTVYGKALAYFTPDELAEAFAATRGVASPTQLRNSLKADGRDLLAWFRALAPARRRVAIQRWSFRRVALIVASVTVVSIVASYGIQLFFPSRSDVLSAPCDSTRTMILMAQAVPTAERLPCIHQLPPGWHVAGASIERGRAEFDLEVDFTGGNGIELQVGGNTRTATTNVILTATCPSIVPGVSGGSGTRGFTPDSTAQTIDVRGGCVVYRTSLPASEGPGASFDDGSLLLLDRSSFVATVERQSDLALCGAGADCG